MYGAEYTIQGDPHSEVTRIRFYQQWNVSFQLSPSASNFLQSGPYIAVNEYSSCQHWSQYLLGFEVIQLPLWGNVKLPTLIFIRMELNLDFSNYCRKILGTNRQYFFSTTVANLNLKHALENTKSLGFTLGN